MTKVADLVQNNRTQKFEALYNGKVLASSNRASYVIEMIRSGMCNKAKQYGVTDVVDKTGGKAFAPVSSAAAQP
jgi:hypothetical protein